ncbi:MAG: putative sugar nucleotidyl transferase [Chitinophagaceae bacterium]|nr:putative sugar nucleotidyl transferase [Chitinophagaceae bacterium]
MHIILLDNPITKKNLLPLTYIRPVSNIRCGIFTIHEKWKKYTNTTVSILTEEYLHTKFPPQYSQKNIYVDSSTIPNKKLVDAVCNLKNNEGLFFENTLIAFSLDTHLTYSEAIRFNTAKKTIFTHSYKSIQKVWNIFEFNAEEIQNDFSLVTHKRNSYLISDPFSHVYASKNIFIEENVSIKSAILNAETGPIYIGANTEVGEGTIIRGPVALCENVTTNMGTKLRPNTTIGPFSKVGGEISSSVLFGYSNKAHDGFLGNSVIAEWCNLGANTNTSNLKNNYKNVSMWNYETKSLEETAVLFCGIIMGDYSRSSINTMFNTGTTVGIGCNIFGHGFPKKYIPNFTWSDSQNDTLYAIEKLLETIENMFQRRKKIYTDEDKQLLQYLYSFVR